MLKGTHKGKHFIYNQFYMEIYEELPDGKLRKKRDFHKWESLVSWIPEHNILASESINKMNGFCGHNCVECNDDEYQKARIRK